MVIRFQVLWWILLLDCSIRPLFLLQSAWTGGSARLSGTFECWRRLTCLLRVRRSRLFRADVIAHRCQVFSHHMPDNLSCFHGIIVTSYGRLLSLRSRPGASFAAGILALCIALQMMSLTMLCRLILAALWRHQRPWMPLLSSCFPQGQRWDSKMLMPSLIPVAMLMVSFVIRSRPTEVIGGARSQCPECGAAAVRKRSWSRDRLVVEKFVAIFLATKLSHYFCFPCLASVVTSLAVSFFHASTVLTLSYPLGYVILQVGCRFGFAVCLQPMPWRLKVPARSHCEYRDHHPLLEE